MTPTFIYLNHILDKNVPRYIVINTFSVVGGVFGVDVHFEYCIVSSIFKVFIKQLFGQKYLLNMMTAYFLFKTSVIYVIFIV